MAKIDDSVKKKVPELRFPGFTDDWEERKLGKFSDVRDGTHASPKYVSQGHPMVTSKNLTHSGLDMTDVSFLTDEDFNEINKRSKISIGDILFGMIGTIGNPVIVDRDDFAIKNVALIKEKTSNPITNKWLLQYLKSPSFNRFIQKENAGGTQKFIALGLIRDMKLRVPEFDEQQKIGSFFKQLDNTITLHQRKLDLLKEQKKGYLQKMFPKNGAKVPELRFAGFADDWEERKLADVVSISAGGDVDKTKLIEDGGYPVLANALTNSGIVGYYDSYKVEAPAVTVTGRGDVGHAVARHVNFTPVVRLLSLKSEVLDADFLANMLNQTNILIESTGVPQLTAPQLGSYKILYPNLNEQTKIGKLLNAFDNLIALHQRKLDLLKEQKKGFLQNMFV
ncbi:restriction endonuclease subunit S [Latilactobacillus sakei]|uniref:restriction endonuclease subunit S n=1 Tax=Latilactobacillus sakei TaxID=1599 RepID=UPI003F52AC82